jgi:hypothetical protein
MDVGGGTPSPLSLPQIAFLVEITVVESGKRAALNYDTVSRGTNNEHS